MYLTDNQVLTIKEVVEDQMAEIIACTSATIAKKLFTKLLNIYKSFDDKTISTVENYLLERNKIQTATQGQESQGRNRNRAPKLVRPAEVLNQLLGTSTKKAENNKRISVALFNLILLLKRPQASPYLLMYQLLKHEKSKEAIEEISKAVYAKLDYYDPKDDTEMAEKAIAALNKIINKQKEKITTLNTRNQELEKKASELGDNNAASSAEKIAKLNEQIKNFEIRLSTANLLSTERVKSNETFKSENQTLRMEQSQLREKISHLETQLAKKPSAQLVPMGFQLPPGFQFVPTDQGKLTSANQNQKNSSPILLGSIAKQLIFTICKNFVIKLEDPIFKPLLNPKFEMHEHLPKLVKLPMANRRPFEDNEKLEMIIWLLKNHFKNDNLNVSTNSGWTLLKLATYFNDPDVVNKLCASGADPGVKSSDDGFDPLALAIYMGHEKLVPNLFDLNYTIQHKNNPQFILKKHYTISNTKLSLLDLAIKFSKYQSVELLLSFVELNKDQYNTYITCAIVEKNDLQLLKIILADITNKRIDISLDQFIDIVDDLVILKVLLSNGAYLNSSNTPSFIKETNLIPSNLHFAAAINDVDLCKKFLTDVNILNENNVVESLYIAAIKSHNALVKIFLDSMEINAYTLDLDKLVYIISQAQNPKSTFEVLLNNQILWESLTPEQTKAFIIEIRNSSMAQQIIPILEQDIRFERFLTESYTLNIRELVLSNTLTEEEIIKKISADLKYCLRSTLKETSILSLAVENNKLLVAKALLEIGADANELLLNSETLLHVAIAKGFHQMGRLLLQFKADINLTSMQGDPLSYALTKKDVVFIKMLTNKELIPEQKIITALQLSLESVIKQDKFETFNLIKENCPTDLLIKSVDVRLMNILIARNRAKIIEKLMPLRLDWAAINQYKTSSLSLAGYSGIMPIIALLNKAYTLLTIPIVDSKDQNEDDFFAAIDAGDIDKTLAYINKKIFKIDHFSSTREMTPLMTASLRGHVKLAQILIENGANLELKTKKHGLQAMHFAAMGDHQDLMQVLSKHNNNESYGMYNYGLSKLDMPSLANLSDFWANSTSSKSNNSPQLSPKRKTMEPSTLFFEDELTRDFDEEYFKRSKPAQ